MSGTEAGAEKEPESNRGEVGKEEPTRDDLGKGIIALSSDEDDAWFSKGRRLRLRKGKTYRGDNP